MPEKTQDRYEDGNLFFFYGSLRGKYWNHFRLNCAPLVAVAETVDKFRLFVSSCNHVPCIVPDENGYAIKGEVYLLTPETADMIRWLERGYRWANFPVRCEDGSERVVKIFFCRTRDENPYSSGTNDVEEITGDYANAVKPR